LPWEFALSVPSNQPSGAGQGHQASLECSVWIAQIAQGDEAALSSLYHATVKKVYGLALRVVQNPACAEEVVEDVYLQVWRTAASFDGQRGNPISWLLMIARSKAITKLHASDTAISVENIDFYADVPAAQGSGPQLDCMTSEQDKILHLALTTLKARERQMLAMAFFHSMTHSEIAEHMRLPLGTVKTCLRRALLCLREQLRPFELGG
jgi:RNA polymerase sigma-70 factor (ECF subfamily)